MTDEKMAEEYARPWKTSLAYVSVKEAHLAGLKAGRPKWHNLQKDPNDLPKVNQKVLLQIKDEGRPIIDFYTRYGVWNFTNEYEAIAWCEIPKFDEE
jgi:hypothetical protein